MFDYFANKTHMVTFIKIMALLLYEYLKQSHKKKDFVNHLLLLFCLVMYEDNHVWCWVGWNKRRSSAEDVRAT